MNTQAIELRSIFKAYDGKSVINDLSLTLNSQEVFGLLGPNGAGKSTTLKMIYGAVVPDKGEVFVLGLNGASKISEIKSRIGIVPQEDSLDEELSIRENLQIFGSFYKMPKDKVEQRIDSLFQLLRLEEHSQKNINELSGGLRRRVAVARALLHEPQLLVLDEPTIGLDPQTRNWFWDFLKKQKAQGLSIVLTTHYMEEAESICDRIAIIDEGKVLTVGRPRDLIEEHCGQKVVEIECSNQDIPYYSNRLKESGFQYQAIRSQLHVFVKDDVASQKITAMVTGKRVTVRLANLSDVFLKLSGRDLRDEPL